MLYKNKKIIIAPKYLSSKTEPQSSKLPEITYFPDSTNKFIKEFIKPAQAQKSPVKFCIQYKINIIIEKI